MSTQQDFADRSRSFDADPLAHRRARALVEVVTDALVRRYGSLEAAAAALDRVFRDEGRPVSAAVLRSASRNAERNYFRLEWVVPVLDDPEVAAAFAPPPRSPEEELARLREHFARNAPGELERFDRRRGAR